MSLINYDKAPQSPSPEAKDFDPAEVYSCGHAALFARLENGSLAMLRAYGQGGSPQIDALVMEAAGPKEEILPGVITVAEVKAGTATDKAGLYREAAGAGNEARPWLPAHFVVCVPVRSENGVEFQLQIKRIDIDSGENEQEVDPGPGRRVRFPRGSGLDLTLDL